MGHRHAQSLTFLDEGDIELYHPVCRTKVLITHLGVTRHRENAAQLYCEAICPTCNTYVYLAIRDSNLKLTDKDDACTGRQGRRVTRSGRGTAHNDGRS